MRVILPSFAKLNLTLRVVSRRPDGLHNLVSLFLRIPSCEFVSISETDSRDKIATNMNLNGENIILKALRISRESGIKIPFLDIKLHKNIVPGSGLGAGSGNAACVLKFFGAEKFANLVGSDVPFLCSDHRAALVAGIGDAIEKLDDPLFHGIVIFPDWKVDTGNAYKELDDYTKNQYVFDISMARNELKAVYSRINSGGHIGVLPNDFSAPLMANRKEYSNLFEIFKNTGSIAWGITGSGSACFGLYKEKQVPSDFSSWPKYIREVLFF